MKVIIKIKQLFWQDKTAIKKKVIELCKACDINFDDVETIFIDADSIQFEVTKD